MAHYARVSTTGGGQVITAGGQNGDQYEDLYSFGVMPVQRLNAR